MAALKIPIAEINAIGQYEAAFQVVWLDGLWPQAPKDLSAFTAKSNLIDNWVIPNALHLNGIFVTPEEYKQKMLLFFNDL